METQEKLSDEAGFSPESYKQSLEILTPEAKAFLEKTAEDRFSFEHLLPRNYFSHVGRVIFYPLTVNDLGAYVGYDDSAPHGAKTVCAVCLSDLVCDIASWLYPEDEHLQYLLYMWKELEDAASQRSFPRKRPSEVISLKKEFHKIVSSWPLEEIHRLHRIFSRIAESRMKRSRNFFSPRYITRIHMRETDGELIGQIQKSRNGQDDVRNGSFVVSVVASNTCFSRIPFTLGLKPGCHVIAACGNADGYGKIDEAESHLHLLRNFRMVLDSNKRRNQDPNRNSRGGFEKFGMLYAQTYKDAYEVKKLKDADAKEVTLEDLWLGKVSAYAKVNIPASWVIGEELKKELGQPDESLRHTVRAVALRRNLFSGEGEVLTVTEYGDNPEGRTGKPPLVGLPGGMREDNATILQTLCRETENESQTKSLEKVFALVGLHKKNKRMDSDQENLDHWFYVKLDKEAGLSKKLIEGKEIYAVRWIPISELATCGFQYTGRNGRTVWDVRKVHEQKLFSVNHADWLAKIIPLIISKDPGIGIKLPDNWNEFLENIRKFQTE